MLSNTQLAQLIYGEIEKRIVLEEVVKGRKREQDIENQKRFRK